MVVSVKIGQTHRGLFTFNVHTEECAQLHQCNFCQYGGKCAEVMDICEVVREDMKHVHDPELVEIVCPKCGIRKIVKGRWVYFGDSAPPEFDTDEDEWVCGCCGEDMVDIQQVRPEWVTPI